MATDKTDEILTASKRAVVFNKYIQTRGGGERATFDFARALSELGYKVTIVTDEIFNNDLSAVLKAFGKDYKDFGYIEFNNEEELIQYVKGQDVDLFVNHSFSSFIPSFAKRSIYTVMFPNTTIETSIKNLRTYDLILCISYFTQVYVYTNWAPDLNVRVLHPPISSSHTEQPSVSFSEKEKLVINIGRFSVNGHKKCQYEAIDMFCQLVDSGTFDRGWRLVVAGHVEPSGKVEEYIARCQERAKGYNIEIRRDLEFDELCKLYRRASLLWQFTGVGLQYGKLPQLCEHLGLVALDCFAYGTIPVVYQRTGMSYNIIHGLTGYLFKSIDDLKESMDCFVNNFGFDYHRHQFDMVKAESVRFSYESFKKTLATFV